VVSEDHRLIALLGRHVGLILLLLGGSPNSSLATTRDTITVDGIALRLDLDVQEAGRSTGRRRGVSPWARPDVELSLWTGGFRSSESVEGVAVEAMAGRSVRPAVAVEAAWIWRQDNRSLRLGLRGGVREVWTYDVQDLDDSLYAIAGNGEAGLEQWIQWTYELGIELDTIALPVSRNRAREIQLNLDRGGRLGNRTKSGMWWAGVHMGIAMLDRSDTEVERLPLNGRPEPASVAGEDRPDWIDAVTLGVGVHLGMSTTLGSGWTCGWRGGWTAGLRSGLWGSVRIGRRLGR
jgi:hypothetical protein